MKLDTPDVISSRGEKMKAILQWARKNGAIVVIAGVLIGLPFYHLGRGLLASVVALGLLELWERHSRLERFRSLQLWRER